jgi:alkaline phosphatase
VGAVEAWVERHGGWDETLLVVTADHDHLLWGPNADAVAFDPLADRGPGRLPGHRWLGTGHSNALVPLFARGAVAETFPARAAHTDPVRGAYLDQTDVFRILAAAMEER